MGLATEPPTVAGQLRDTARPYQLCGRCVMDTSDVDIVFDSEGICNHCTRAERLLRERLPMYRDGEYRLERMVQAIRDAGRRRQYDCIVGVSGGVDSTYAVLTARRLGLRPLAVHFDNGWNSELAVANIGNTLQRLGVELYTYVVDWEEFRDLQLSFLRASVPDGEIPTDHAIWALLFRVAVEFRIPYVISGTNLSTESILPRRWTHSVTDWTYIRSVHRRYGSRALRTYPRASTTRFLWTVLARGVRTYSVLNSVDYDKHRVLEELEAEVGYRRYRGKHHESIYTRFFQQFILPQKFGFDKRRAHLSALIVSGQATRDEALLELSRPPADAGQLAEDRQYVIKKLAISEAEFDRIMALPPRTYRDFRTQTALHDRLRRARDWAQRRGMLPGQIRL